MLRIEFYFYAQLINSSNSPGQVALILSRVFVRFDTMIAGDRWWLQESILFVREQRNTGWLIVPPRAPKLSFSLSPFPSFCSYTILPVSVSRATPFFTFAPVHRTKLFITRGFRVLSISPTLTTVYREIFFLIF